MLDGAVDFTKVYEGRATYTGIVSYTANFTKVYVGLEDYVRAYRVAITYTGDVNYTKSYTATYVGNRSFTGIHQIGRASCRERV